MTEVCEVGMLVGSLRVYLEELRESGVEGLPWEEVESNPSAGQNRQHESLDMVRSELGTCLRCQLGATRTNLVFGVGNPAARVVFVGEAPGRDEDLQGEPFVGEAGQLLTKIIQAMGFARNEVYICNVLKCRPPHNRNPLQPEIEQCQPFLRRQLAAIAPEVIVALGTFPAQALLDTKEPISRLRGRFHDYHGVPLMPTFHPAFLLRNPEKKREVWTDMQEVMKRLGKELPQNGKG